VKAEAQDKCIKLLIKPDWSEIAASRIETRKFLEKNLFQKNHIARLEMVASELMENAIKYGYYPEKNESIEYSVEIGNTGVILEVKHKIIPDDMNLQIFDSRIQWIRSFQDPFQAYVERLKYVSEKSFADAESGLGLARIAYEGHSIIDFYLSENNILAVSAVYRVNNPME